MTLLFSVGQYYGSQLLKSCPWERQCDALVVCLAMAKGKDIEIVQVIDELFKVHSFGIMLPC